LYNDNHYTLKNSISDAIVLGSGSVSGCQPFGEGEIQGLFQDFQGPFSVNSRTGLSRPFFSKFKDLELGKIFENGTDFRL
jgi:hypothetical protein